MSPQGVQAVIAAAACERDLEDDEPLFFSRQLGAAGRRKAIDRVRAWQIVKAASERADIHVLALRACTPSTSRSVMTRRAS